jgi:carboxymethylenebutenolidase
MGQMVNLTASDGFKLSAYRAEPAGKPRGGLVVIQEIFGVNSHVRDVSDGFAKDGYLVIAPALFDRAERNVDLGYTPADVSQGVALKAKCPIDKVLLDVSAAIDAVKSAGKVGITGYCWGGYVSWMAAARLKGLACSVPYYGGGMLEAVNEQPQCPVMAHFGRKDAHIPAAGVEKFAAAHPTHQVFLYDADHGFNCDQRGSHDAAAARLARERTIEFLRKHVG